MTVNLEGVTATGQQLAQRLTALIGGLMANEVPATIGRRLAESVAATERRMARRAALKFAMSAVNPDKTLSLWESAKRLEDALKRFQAVGYQRVRDGHRPASQLDRAFCVLLANEGRAPCQRTIWEILHD